MRLTLYRSERRPLTELTWDGETLTATDAGIGESVRLIRPASLYHYAYDAVQPVAQRVTGLAVLDADGLVLLDLPGAWDPPQVRALGIPVLDGSRDPAARTRAMLAARAPGWRRLRGVPRPVLLRWRLPLIYGGAALALAVAAYLISIGAYAAWRGMSMVLKVAVDLLEVKWLALAFSPALLVLRPVRVALHRLKLRSGRTAGPLSVRGTWLRLEHGIPDVALERAGSVLLYQYEDLRGLFVMDVHERPLRHVPGPWPADVLHRFTERHGMRLAVHRISRQEYLHLVRSCPQALP